MLLPEGRCFNNPYQNEYEVQIISYWKRARNWTPLEILFTRFSCTCEMCCKECFKLQLILWLKLNLKNVLSLIHVNELFYRNWKNIFYLYLSNVYAHCLQSSYFTIFVRKKLIKVISVEIENVCHILIFKGILVKNETQFSIIYVKMLHILFFIMLLRKKKGDVHRKKSKFKIKLKYWPTIKNCQIPLWSIVIFYAKINLYIVIPNNCN